MPESPCTRRASINQHDIEAFDNDISLQANVVSHTIIGLEDRVHMNFSTERFGWLSGSRIGLVCATNELHLC